MAKLETKNYLKKRIVRFFFNEKSYHTIKFYKIIFDFWLGKTYEPFINKLPSLLKKEGTMLDIGANMGQYMLPLCRQFPNSTVLSFEPIPVNYNFLCKARKLFNLRNVVCFDFAFSDNSGKEKIIIPYLNGIPITTRSVLKKSMIYNSSEKLIEMEVFTKTIDEFVKKEETSCITFIKIDAEGAEDRILKGGRNTIKTFNPILQLETSLENPEVQKLINQGYEAFYFHQNELVETHCTKAKGDLILIHR